MSSLAKAEAIDEEMTVSFKEEVRAFGRFLPRTGELLSNLLAPTADLVSVSVESFIDKLMRLRLMSTFDDFTCIRDKFVGQLTYMNQAVLMNSQINKGTKLGNVADGAL